MKIPLELMLVLAITAIAFAVTIDNYFAREHEYRMALIEKGCPNEPN